MTASDRVRALRDRTSNAYGRARNNAEREVVDLVRQHHPAIYASEQSIANADRPGASRSVIQAAIRQGICKWYRETYPDDWAEILARHVEARRKNPDAPVESRRKRRH